LQEIATARHILIICGLTVIDGVRLLLRCKGSRRGSNTAIKERKKGYSSKEKLEKEQEAQKRLYSVK
jgi:hypothetical protein